MDASPGYSRDVNTCCRDEDDEYGGMTPPVRTEY
ncbi:unnamed protein product [Bathycoccus prasinos]